jgi:protein TonB
MIAILSIIAVVALITLYDYFGSKGWQQVTSSVRNNVVFENRNREYGAYVIRRDYDKTLVLIMGSVLLSVGGLYAGFALTRSNPLEEIIQSPTNTDVEIAMVLPAKEVPEVETPEPVKQSSTEATKQFVEPKVEDKPVDTKLKTQEELDKSKAGSSDQEKKGEGPIITYKEPEKVKEKEPIVPKGPEMFVDVDAQYPGGREAMIDFIQRNLEFPPIALDMNIQGKCFLRFVVGVDGSISSVNVLRGIAGCPECDWAAVKVLKSMPNWKPGKLRGEEVSSYFDLPINFEIE